MKTTMTARKVANPRRTTLAHLSEEEAARLAPQATPTYPVELPRSTANPRRTRLMEVPRAAGRD